jgi:peroxiredoxin
VIRLLVALAAVVCTVAAQQAILWWVFLPSLGRQQVAQINAIRTALLEESSMLHVGDPAPDFSLTTADGAEFSLSDAKGKVVLINFFATWCGPCQLELPHIDRIWSDRKDNDKFRLVVIGREESLESVREFREKHGYSFPIAADPDRSVYALFARESIPRTLVVSPEGRIVYSKAGFQEADLIELNAILDEQLAL